MIDTGTRYERSQRWATEKMVLLVVVLCSVLGDTCLLCSRIEGAVPFAHLRFALLPSSHRLPLRMLRSPSICTHRALWYSIYCYKLGGEATESAQ